MYQLHMQQIKFVFALTLSLAVFGISNVSAYGELPNFEGYTDGWAILNGEAQRASMSFVGNGTLEDKIWKLQTTAKIDSDDAIEVDLIGSANPDNGKIRLSGTGTGDNDVKFIVILRGNYAPIENLENGYALDWTFSMIHWPLYDKQLRLFQDGFIFVR